MKPKTNWKLDWIDCFSFTRSCLKREKSWLIDVVNGLCDSEAPNNTKVHFVTFVDCKLMFLKLDYLLLHSDFYKTPKFSTAERDAQQAKTINKLISSKQFSINWARECSLFTNNQHLSEMPMQFLTSAVCQGCHPVVKAIQIYLLLFFLETY